MIGTTVRHFANSVFLALEAFWCFEIMVRGMRQDPKDRVFWFEACAMMSLGAACLIAYFWGTATLPVSIAFGILFLVFAALAGYSALMNWVQRKKWAT
jgi:hypothetical protein